MKKLLPLLLSIFFSSQVLAMVEKKIYVQNMSGKTVYFSAKSLFNLELDKETSEKHISLAPYETKHITVKITKDDGVVEIFAFDNNNQAICECSAQQKTDRSLSMSLADVLPNSGSSMRCVVTDDHEALTIQE